MPKDRGAEQGDVESTLECSFALGTVAAETLGRVAAQQVSGSLPWIGVDDPPDIQRLQAEHAVRMQRHFNFQLDGPEKLTGADGPRLGLQENGSLADLWYMADGDIMCHPISVPSHLHEFVVANARVGAERNPHKTEVIHHVEDLNAAPPGWKVDDVKKMAAVSIATGGSTILGVAVGPQEFIADQLLAKADVIRAMHERVQLCQDAQTEFAHLCESLGRSHQPHSASARPHDLAGETRC